ncbi:MAG: nucleotidyltransferase domain-containing protein [bacterium]|nr:nucleotidyltransferase domain-containing protein [bacterium]
MEQVLCVGSYARNDWGVGSDLDLIVVLSGTTMSSVQRHAQYAPEGLPVQADLWVYTRDEWDALAKRAPQLRCRLDNEGIDLTSTPVR